MSYLSYSYDSNEDLYFNQIAEIINRELFGTITLGCWHIEI